MPTNDLDTLKKKIAVDYADAVNLRSGLAYTPESVELVIDDRKIDLRMDVAAAGIEMTDRELLIYSLGVKQGQTEMIIRLEPALK